MLLPLRDYFSRKLEAVSELVRLGVDKAKNPHKLKVAGSSGRGQKKKPSEIENLRVFVLSTPRRTRYLE